MPQLDPILGIFAPEIPWLPSVAHIIRRAAIFDAIQDQPVGRVLEIGCGAGAFLYDLQARGFYGKGVDTSESALKVARYFHAGGEDRISLAQSLDDEDRARYDYVMAFEVLEHIEDDMQAVSQWKDCLKPSGKIIISVPAHRKMWGASDEWAGHIRRYDLADLHNCLNAAGLEIESSYCYGFPILNFLAPLGNLICKIKSAKRKRKMKEIDVSYATSISGTDRVFESRIFHIYANFLAKVIFRLLFVMQRKVYSLAWGTGYIVIASSKSAPDVTNP
jgi:SAM-dependent methyltransferase